jgi:Flp pilus assembly protein TadG
MRADRTSGQALVEFAITMPLFVLVVFVTIQLSLLFVAYYSETRMARESARWAAINGDATDLQVAQHIQDTLLPGLVGVASPGTVTVANKDTVKSTATDTVYKLGRMEAQFTACGAAIAPCPASNRAPGNTLYVLMSYDVSNLLFLPSTYRLGSLVTTIPTTLPGYRVSVMVE